MKSLLLLTVASVTVSAAPPEPKFKAQDLDRGVQIGYGLAIADVDGDKLPDILLADKKQFRWYKNPGKRGAEWSKYVMAENLTKNDNVCIAAQDIDGDGKCEVAVGAEWNPGDTVGSGAVFYLVAPADRTQPWEAVKFPAVEPTTHRMKWVHFGEAGWRLVVLPLHGRGNKNNEGTGVKVLAYQKPADPKGEWPSTALLDESFGLHATHNFDVIPGGPFPGVLVGSKEAVLAVHWTKEKAAAELFSLIDKDDVHHVSKGGAAEARPRKEWSPKFELSVFPDFKGAGEIRAGLQANGQPFYAAIEPMHGDTLAVYQVKSSPLAAEPASTASTRTVLTDKLIQGHALACGNVLGTKGDQVVVGWRGGKPGDKVGIAVWTPLDEHGLQWRETIVDDSETACEDLALADLDGDGKLDIIAAGRATHNLRVLWNERTE